jgi:CRP-like cAMP-binding protein
MISEEKEPMLSRKDLKQIVLLGHLTDEMLDKIVPITDLLIFNEKEFVFQQGEKADRFYMLQQGKVILELTVTDKLTISVSAIKPGYSFGWSAMLEDERYTVNALCSEPSRILSLREEKLKALLEQDPSMGYIMSQRLLVIMKKRYDIRTEQFIKTITHHPDIAELL